MTASREDVILLEKHKPRQARAKRTYEGILAAAAELLIEVGVERISTNLIAERAGITVPALYRYFPNKYAVLHALGAVLMDRQNEVCGEWFEKNTTAENPTAVLVNVDQLLKITYDITREQVAGLEIVQTLRAVAPLQELRLQSHHLVAAQFAEAVADLVGRPLDDDLILRARLSVEVGYSVVEMALEDESVSPITVMEQGAEMIRLYWLDVFEHLDSPGSS